MMTREEAIKTIEIIDRRYMTLENDERNALKMAIKALKQEQCEDCISRQAVLDIITEQERLASDRVRDTPSSLGNELHTWVNPAYTRYSKQLSERSQFKTMIQTMPPVTPQPKTGYISIDDAMSVFNDFMYGDADENDADTFLEMLKDKAESEEE